MSEQNTQQKSDQGSQELYLQMRKDYEAKDKQELIDKLFAVQSECKDHRLEKKELKEKLELVSKELTANKDVLTQFPALQSEAQKLKDELQRTKDAEKKRRETILAKHKLEDLDYLTNPEAIDSEQFEKTLEKMSTQTSGHKTPLPAGHIPDNTPNPFIKGKDFSITKQIEIKKNNPDLWKKFRHEAGLE